jgi:putative heme transporter
MSQNSFLRRRWKLLLNIATIVAVILFLFLIREQIIETFKNLGRIHWWVLLLIALLQLWNYDAQTRMYLSLFKIVGNNFKYKPMFIAALELNFINNVFPSGGVSGISYFGVRLRSEKVTAGKATLVQIMKLLMLYVSFEVLLVIGIFLLAAEGHINDLVLMSAVAISTALILGTGLFVYILGSKQRVEQFFRLIKRLTNKVVRRVRRGPHRKPIEMEHVHFLLAELHDNFKTIKSRMTDLKWPLVHALFANLTEIMCIYVIYIAFGEWVNFGAIIIAYSVANFAGLISVLPGGVGIYEVLMTTVLVAAGVPVALSLPVTIMYRVLTAGIQLPPGYYFYHRALNSKGMKLEPHNG